MKAMPSDILKNLEERARYLASRNCHFMAGTLIQYYDGDCAEETKDARLQVAKHYFDLAHQQTEQRAL